MLLKKSWSKRISSKVFISFVKDLLINLLVADLTDLYSGNNKSDWLDKLSYINLVVY